MERKKIKEIVLKASDGLLESVTDGVLYFLFYEIEALDRLTSKNVFLYAPAKASRDLEKINYQVIKRAVENLLVKKLVKREGGKLKITPEGEERIKKILPSLGFSKERKPGEVYLVAYDVTETTSSGRTYLRRLLKKNRAVAIQKSLYVLISNPQTEIEQLLKEISLEGQVLVTKLGKDSLIGGRSLAEFLWEKYQLEKINALYKEFIDQFSKIPLRNLTAQMLDFAFNKIFVIDPCFPSEFLKDGWNGARALKLYEDLKRRIT